jgi:hypothetical protein
MFPWFIVGGHVPGWMGLTAFFGGLASVLCTPVALILTIRAFRRASAVEILTTIVLLVGRSSGPCRYSESSVCSIVPTDRGGS